MENKNSPNHNPDNSDRSDDPQRNYLDSLGGDRTARGASEKGKHALPEKIVTPAVIAIRGDIKPVFPAPSIDLTDTSAIPIDQRKAGYWERAQHVGTEFGAKPGYDMEDYLTVEHGRSFEDIKAEIEEVYEPGSIARNALDAIDLYHSVLGINPAYAATITSKLIGRGLPKINKQAENIAQRNGCSLQEAGRIAFDEFITTEVPYHVSTIIVNQGYGDAAVKPYFQKDSFYPEDEREESDASFQLSVEDANGLVEAYDIQSRPYDNEELTLAREIGTLPEMQAAMIRTQEALVDFSEKYLAEHPDRASKDLRNFSEIFVAQETEDGGRVFLPNPKLLRAMVNNILPGVAKSMLGRELSADQIDEAAIAEGIQIAAKEYQLFHANIGQFNAVGDTGVIELRSIYKVVCPAGAFFPKFLSERLPEYFRQEKEAAATAATEAA